MSNNRGTIVLDYDDGWSLMEDKMYGLSLWHVLVVNPVENEDGEIIGQDILYNDYICSETEAGALMKTVQLHPSWNVDDLLCEVRRVELRDLS